MSADDSGEPPASAAAGLRVRLFGPPEIRVGGAVLTLSDQKAQALLCYLAATGQSHTRGHLATLLWSESPESNARHSLRSSLYHLRRALHIGGSAATLVVTSNMVHLRLSEDACDVTRFRHLVALNSEHALAEASSLYRGTLLEGLTLIDAPVFDEWLRAEAASLSQAHLNTLERLATWAEAREAWGEAIQHVQRIVQLDALDEDAQRRLIRLYLQSGATGRALRQYQQLETELKRQLGFTPSPETQELIQRALRPRGRTAPLATPASPLPWHASPRMRPAPAVRPHSTESAMPLVGRDDLLTRLLTLSQQPLSGHGTAILLQGESGMGKTRLLDELAVKLSAQSPSWIVLRGSCSPFDDLLSYGPFYEALQTAASGDLTDLLVVERGARDSEAATIMWRVLQTLRLLTQGGPLLLTIDDLHWANSSTLHLFGFLATRLRAVPVLLVGTIQHWEAIPAVQRLLALGRHRGEVHLVPVTPLDLKAVADLLQTLGLSSDAAASLAEWLQERSGGSPFMLSEILAQLRADAILTPAEPGWRLDTARWLRGRISFTLPDTTHDLVAWRLASLSPGALHILDVVAVAGHSLPLALLHEFPGVETDRFVQTVDDLLSRGFLIEVADEAFALPHHLLREALLSRLSHLRRRTIHRQLLDAMEQCPALQAHFPRHQVALHAVAAEDGHRARRYGLGILDELLLDAPSAETLSFAQHLHDLLAPSASPDEMLRLTAALGQLHQSLGQLEAARHWYRQQLDIACTGSDPMAQTVAHFEMGELALVTSDYPAAVAAATTGLALCKPSRKGPNVTLAGRGHRLLGAALAMEGSDLYAAEVHLQQAAAAHQRAGSASDLCAALFELGNVAAQRGQLARALASYEEAGRAAESGHVYYYLALAHNNIAYHSLLLGRLEAAQQAAAHGQRVAEAHELVGALSHLYSTLGEIRLYLAEWATAAEWFGRGLALAEDLGHLERQAGYRAGLALVARGQHDHKSAVALLEEARTLLVGQGHWHLQTRILLWLAETWLLHGHISEAAPHLDAALATARTQERALLLIQSERLYAHLLAATGKWPEANVLFASTIERAAGLDLPLEIARTQADWGAAALHFAPPPHAGDTLLAAARETFAAHDARADLEALHMALHH